MLPKHWSSWVAIDGRIQVQQERAARRVKVAACMAWVVSCVLFGLFLWSLGLLWDSGCLWYSRCFVNDGRRASGLQVRTLRARSAVAAATVNDYKYLTSVGGAGELRRFTASRRSHAE